MTKKIQDKFRASLTEAKKVHDKRLTANIELTKTILAKLEESQNEKDIDWSHAGSQGYYAEKLLDIAIAMGIVDEDERCGADFEGETIFCSQECEENHEKELDEIEDLYSDGLDGVVFLRMRGF